jgi:chromosome segregation protein
VGVFLKSIELFGFKSFPDRTRVQFQRGISVILGPNGCGKSNIVDAIKWVVGEQSTKTLRAARMEDVIFSGTENRRALNVAEVTLILSNDGGIFPLDLPEISIKRRLYRSGESEYFINKNLVRLREMKELFYDTGIGKSAYSVMEQGEIDQILSTRPEERRYIFEEAAGITKYKAKRLEAERKLERTEENMRQVEGILVEVKRSYGTLKVQSEKTQVFRSLKDRIFEDELEIELLRLKDLTGKKDKKDEELKSQQAYRKDIQADIDRINQSMEKSIDTVNSMESELVEVQKKLYGIDIERDNRASQIKMLQERIQELEKKIREDELREKGARDKLFALREELGRRNDLLQSIAREAQEIESNIRGFQKDINHFTEKIAVNESLIAKHDEETKRLEESIDSLRGDLRKITDDIVTQLDQRLKEIGYSYYEHKNLERQIEELLGSLKIQLEGRTALVEDAKKLGSKTASIQRMIESIRGLLRESLDRIQMLDSLFSQYKKATPTFIDEFLAPEGIITRKREIDEKISVAHRTILKLRGEIAKKRDENRQIIKRINEYRKTLEELRVNRARVDTQKAAITDEAVRLEREISEQEDFLKKNTEEVIETRKSIKDLSLRVEAIEAERTKMLEQEKELKRKLGKLERDISEKNTSLAAQEQILNEKMERITSTQTQIESLQIELAEIKTEIKNVYHNFMEKHSRDLQDYETRMYEIKTPQRQLRADLVRLREELKDLGHVNLMAPEEFLEVKERYEFLEGQIEDLRRAREDLAKITEEIKRESAELFMDTYDRIKKNFHLMIRRLFGGGRAELRLLNQGDVLDSGIEIYAQPPGKKLENIALLSGGERALTAVALLFATYLAKPSPFCILDEIDAALDEENVGRFVNLLKEFSHATQFIIVTHNKRTIVGAETLLGITMEESGVSKLITTRLKNHEPQEESVAVQADV